MALIWGLVALAVAAGVLSSKGSFAYAILSGQCSRTAPPPVCFTTARRGFGTVGR